MIDSHAHLDAYGQEVGAVLARARAAGVVAVIAVGSGIESAYATLALSEREEGVYCALGIHPHQAEGPDGGRLDDLRRVLGHGRVRAVGETGLDYYRLRASPAAQRRLFAAQLALARELGLPVVVHSRAAAAETAQALTGFPGTVVLHCFSEPELLPVALERGYYVSFAGNLTYPKAEELRRAASLVPAERLLVETDSPFLAPQPVRGQRNEPAFLLHTLHALAQARGEDAGELADRIAANARTAFSLP